MNTRGTKSAGQATTSALADSIKRLDSARDPDAMLAAAAALLDAARRHCDDSVDIASLTGAADAFLTALAAAAAAERRPALTAVVHDFIDLTRLKSVRRAAYPAEMGLPGGVWLDRVIQLIEQSDFTVGRMIRQRAAQYPHKTLFVVPQEESATEYSWEQVAETTQRIAGGVLALLGDDPRVAILTPNRVEGALFDLACLSNGIFDAPIPGNMVEAQLEHILLQSGARMLVVSGSDQIRSALGMLEAVPTLEWVVTLDPLPTTPAAKVLELPELIERGKQVATRDLEKRLSRVRSSDNATTMYTSGTTDAPKGIQFSHLNIVSKRFARVAALPEIDQDEVLVCYLPLYHTFGRYLEMLAAAHLGATYVFAGDPSTETLVRQMRRFGPTALISVPKKWRDLYHRVTTGDVSPEEPEAARRALHELTGGRLRWGLSAAGHLDPAIFRFFQYHGVDLMSGYGMTEATGGITMTPPRQYTEDTIGKALPAIELRLADDGELLLRGPYVTTHYTDPEEDLQAFRDGWFCTGDIVSRDAGGCYRHVDRKKDIYKNARGRTIAPQRIEGLFADFPEVSRVFAVGDGREYVTLLIRPNMSYPEVAFAKMTDVELREYFSGLVVSCNRFLAPFERVVNFALVNRDFSAEMGEVTPKGSFRRAAVGENFSDVIEPMYVSSAVEREVDGLRVKIPIALLQHLGVTEGGTITDGRGLVFVRIDKRLQVRRDPADRQAVWIGSCCYRAVNRIIDLDDWLRLPELWVGNAELTHLTGDGILLWSLARGDRATDASMVRVAPPEVPISEWRSRLSSPGQAAPSLLTVHAAAVVLFAETGDTAWRAIDYLAHAISAGRVQYQELAEALLRHAAHHEDPAVRSRAFAALLARQKDRSFGRTASAFCGSRLDFLDSDTCAQIATTGMNPEQWGLLSDALAALRRDVTREDSARTRRFVLRLLGALARIAEARDDFYLAVRRELMAWTLAPVSPTIGAAADKISEKVTAAFRRRLGKKQRAATDPQTGRRYSWDQTLRAEDGLDPDEVERITCAFQDTELVRETVYLLNQHRRIDLSDLAPHSIWLNLVETRFGRSIYHVVVQLRDDERLEFTLYVRGAVSDETFRTDLRLMCLAAGHWGEAPLTPQLGGYWPEHGVATLEHISGEPIEALVHHMHEHPDTDVHQRLKDSWRHLSWSTLTAAFEFHRRTESRWMLAGNVARDIRVSLNDYEENARVFSAAAWRPFPGTLDMLLGLKHAFLDRVRFYYPALAPETSDDLLLDAALEVYGVQDGVALLRTALVETEHAEEPEEETAALRRGIEAYIRRVTESGYMPRSLYFAIARYHAWAQQVPDASLYARAAQLRELQNNYRIDALARRFPEVRLWSYAETVLRDSPEEGRRTLDRAMRDLRAGSEIQQVLGRLYAELKERLPSHDQQFFLTRVAYPHLELDENAELVTSTEVGRDRADLVTVHADRTGREIRFRPAASSAEVDALYRIFYVSDIGGGLSAHERLLVALDPAGGVLGGIGHIRRTPYHVLLHKIAVLPRCRSRGIGRLLLHEFLRRRAAESVAVVSAEFILVDWLAQFGFRPDPRYPGVVLSLVEDDWSARFTAQQ